MFSRHILTIDIHFYFTQVFVIAKFDDFNRLRDLLQDMAMQYKTKVDIYLPIYHI